MMSLGVSKGRAIPSTDEDRRRIIKQMKVRTTLKGDKSWIQHHNSDSEDEKKSSSLEVMLLSLPENKPSEKSPAAKPQSGYLIRGVFTRTIDKTSSVPESSSPTEPQNRPATKGQSQCRSSSGYRMTTEDYKKLAPYNVKQKSVDVEEEDVPFTPDEHKKRTEAANSVLRRTASRERAYVLSAAKKSNGSPTQEFPPLFAKRIEIEEEEGQQRRSPNGSGSYRFTPDHNSTNGLKKPTAGSSWNEAKTTAASTSITEPGIQSQTATASSETSERSSTATEFRNGESRQAPLGKSSPETALQRGDSDKTLKEKSELFPWDKPAPRATMVSTNGSYPEHTEASNGFYPPKSTFQSDVPSPPTEKTPVHLDDTASSFKRSILDCEDRSSKPEDRYTSSEVPLYGKPYGHEARSSKDFEEENTPRGRGHETTHASDDYKPELIQEGFFDSNNHTEKGQEPPDHDVHPEPPRPKEHIEHDPSMTRSSSLPRESGITAPEIQCANGSDPCQERTTSAYGEQTHPTTESHRESLGLWSQNKPNPVADRSDFSSKESSLSAYETQHPMPLYMDRQPSNTIMSAPSHRIPSYVDSQAFNTRRSTSDYDGRAYDGRSSPRNSRCDSSGARGHCEFSPAAGRHDSLPRDTTMSISQRSHRVPFYMDTLNYNSTRLPSGLSERICSPMANIAHSSPVASGYQSDSSAAGKGVLFVKEYMNSSELLVSPRYGSGSLVDSTDLERSAYSHHSYLNSAHLQRSSDPVCSYCSREIRDCPKIIIEHLNICCHEYCFRCGICHKAMGDLLDKMFIHRDIVHCDKCYEKLF